MAWCPVCRNEYKEGITCCADCGVELVDELPAERKPIYFGEQEKLEAINDFFAENGVTSGEITFREEELQPDLSVLETDEKKAIRLLGIFLEQEKKNKEKEKEEVRKTKKAEAPRLYVNKKEKAEEYKSSAYTLIGVSILGIIFLICMGLGVLPVHVNSTTKIMMYVVLGGLFVVFFVTGVLSLKTYKKSLAESDDEEERIKKIQKYLEANLTGRGIDESLGLSEDAMSGEAMYFERTEVIENKIKEAFPELEEALVVKLTDDFYTKLYEG